MKGRVHSIETCGTVDGPGLRYVVFLQGCLLRCQFCHNPDTWELNGGQEMTVEEIMSELKDYIPYMRYSGGGITVSGGEPLIQKEFITALFKECKKLNIHTAIDSSGGCFVNSPHYIESLSELFSVTDLVLLDLKHIDAEKHKKLTGLKNHHIVDFAKLLSERNIPVWIRHVLVPGITTDEEDLEKLSAFISTLNNVEKIEILPYHKLGVYKWKELKLPYPLEGVEPPSDKAVSKANAILQKAIKRRLD
ncbi:pyruvate formate-lyase-activating protein [Pradoshia sp.]